MMNVIAAGSGVTGSVDLDNRTLMVKVINTHATESATITFDNGVIITLPPVMTNYEDIFGNYDIFTVSATGTVNYIVFG